MSDREPGAPEPSVAAGRVYVVLVNWNGWRDTIECLESVLRSDHPEYTVIVCDNASGNDSVERLLAWAGGREPFAPDAPLAHPELVTPPVPKPLRVARPRAGTPAADARDAPDARDARLVLIETGGNLGFAGGCNVGIRHALAQPDCAYVWLLNNDTVVEPGAMRAMVRRLARDPRAGQCGSRLVYYDAPPRIQAYGGARYDKWLSRPRPVGTGSLPDAPVDAGAIERELDYVVGASLMVPRRFLEEVGLLEESYFMFFEELDWAARAGNRFTMVYAHDSVVYHKESRGLGSHRSASRGGERADHYQLRNRLRYTWKHARLALPGVVLGIMGAIVNRLRRRQPERALLILRLLFDPRTYRQDGGGPAPW